MGTAWRTTWNSSPKLNGGVASAQYWQKGRAKRFFAPAMTALGRRLVSWGTLLRARYDEAYLQEFSIKEQQ
jgi:hypothetical protein